MKRLFTLLIVALSVADHPGIIHVEHPGCHGRHAGL
jgi:hypothetical protein